jgi:hypothetical protein
MTKYQWTGESEYCICSHHISKHCTVRSLAVVFWVDDSASGCRYYKTVVNDEGETEYRRCKCKEFRPYMTEEVGNF